MPPPPPSRLLIVQCAALGHDLARTRGPKLAGMPIQKARPVFPALTSVAQASFRTGLPPSRHGMVGNGVWVPDLRKALFWEQAAHQIEAPRLFTALQAQGRRVGMCFWQQSLGETADLILSPKPVHKHSGGMIQDVYSQPHDLYQEISRAVGRRFNLMHYWGPLAGPGSSRWITDAMIAVLERPDAPDLLYAYLPHLDYDLQRHGPDHPKAAAALAELDALLTRLRETARAAGYAVLVYGDYAIRPVTEGAVFPNRMLREAGRMRVRTVKGRAYPDLFASRAFAMVDHEIAHLYIDDPADVPRLRDLFADHPGVGEVLDSAARSRAGVDHPRAGRLTLVAETGWWFAYPWWDARREAPDFATHVDIHNKPGYDPCELFWGWPPPSVSLDTSKVRGSHGRADGAEREVAWATDAPLAAAPDTLLGLARTAHDWLAGLARG